MTTKEYLRQAVRLDTIVDLRLAQLERLKSYRERVTTNFTPTPKSGKGGDRISEITIKIWSLEETINKDIDELVDLKADIRSRIAEVQDERFRMVLEYKYLAGYTWDDIAEAMHMDRRWILRLHGRALQEINFDH